ncbi:hypothetical protein [Streptomyces sp. NBC_01217]|uniref:hypothetical protein n=1 Tax=Streptomyces sp. NBC_01217 TaxID=2903779 RepID=UPI002E11B88E|nr:hypothetical protein OG507_22750 [Streptomyces sp. NBC_01217]
MCAKVFSGALPGIPGTRLPTFRINGFSPQALAYLSGHLLSSAIRPRLNRTPLWNEGADQPCETGLWAVEPHIGKGDIAVKWEEMLVVSEDGAHWLDDACPTRVTESSTAPADRTRRSRRRARPQAAAAELSAAVARDVLGPGRACSAQMVFPRAE